MQIFTCPFCGPRDETEFHFGGDAGNARPDGRDVSAADWSRYLYLRNNPKGSATEIWVHLACREFFAMTRDSVTHAVLDVRPLDAEAQ